MVQVVTPAHKGLAPFRLIPYFRKVKMPMLGTHTAFEGQPVKLFDFYIQVYLKVCISDKTFNKQADAKPQPLCAIKLRKCQSSYYFFHYFPFSYTLRVRQL